MSKQTALLLGLALVCSILLIGASSVNAWKFAAVGDIECKSAVKVINSIKTNTPDVKRVLLLGDLGYSSTSKCIKDACDKALLNCLPTVGNHDKTSDVKKVWGKGDSVGTYQTNNVRFLSINTEMSIKDVKSKVNSLLNKYKNDTTINFIIPYEHKPFVTNKGAHHSESDAKGYRTALVPLFVNNGKVQLVLFGHNHNFLQCSSNNISFITIGTGGRDPYPIGSGTDDNCHNGITGTDGYIELDVNGVSMVGVWKDLNGGIREETTFSIIK
jgi:predicted phosphodiesterase